jgi:hypothetical protein
VIVTVVTAGWIGHAVNRSLGLTPSDQAGELLEFLIVVVFGAGIFVAREYR